MKKALIFGSNGFVGPYLAKEFKEQGYLVSGIDIQTETNNEYLDSYYSLDILDEKGVFDVIKNYLPTYIINLAAISSVGLSWKIPSKTFEVNVIGSINIFEAVKVIDKNIKILIVGSSEEYTQIDKPLKETDELCANNPYGISKMTQENMASLYEKRDGLSIIRVRSFNHTGPGQNENFVIPSFCKQIALIENSKMPGKILVGNLSAFRDFSYVCDIVKCYRLLLETVNSGVYNVGSGKSYKMEDILNKIIGFCNYPVEVIKDETKYRPIDTPFICCDNTKIKSLFNIEFTNIDDLLLKMIKFYL